METEKPISEPQESYLNMETDGEKQMPTQENSKSCDGVNIPVITLNSGHDIPVMAFGTSSFPPLQVDQMRSIFLEAIQIGYRHIDTAALYEVEEGVGAGIKAALEKGLVKREELFVTTKLWCDNAHPDRVLPAIKESLRKLGLEYVDLYLIHAAATVAPNIAYGAWKKGEVFPLDIKSVWAAMEEVQKLGLAKSIGVSNFTCKKLTELLAHAKIIPAINQVEMHAAMQQKKLRELCKEKGIHVSAYSPLGGKEWGFDVVLGNELLKEIARNKEKSVAQIALRWVYEQGAVVITKSFNKERLKENLDIFDWKLNEEESKKTELIPQIRTAPLNDFVFEGSPFKTVEEFWDGEL
ncbi:hypothetical protein Sjap_024464 [Stephania japonica]|uniref:codeinone reductase (NADPH) n=1 Tax=Stephania japonica TaxID=461633 RepID=A0AAP0HNR2_9MAGN